MTCLPDRVFSRSWAAGNSIDTEDLGYCVLHQYSPGFFDEKVTDWQRRLQPDGYESNVARTVYPDGTEKFEIPAAILDREQAVRLQIALAIALADPAGLIDEDQEPGR